MDMPVLYRKLRWWERRRLGDEWLTWPTAQWCPVVFTAGMFVFGTVVRRPKEQQAGEHKKVTSAKESE